VASATACAFTTGSAPGWPVHTGHTLVFAGAPKSVEQPHHIFVRVASSTWTSRPTTSSQPAGRTADALIAPPPRRPGPAGTGSKPRSCSKAHATRYIRSSRSSGAITWSPTGSAVPAASGAGASPAGTDSAGMPASDAGTVATSLRYIAMGSAVLVPSPNATVGAVGLTSTSARSKAAAKSRAISVRTLLAWP
jgi:hypothetical protein